MNNNNFIIVIVLSLLFCCNGSVHMDDSIPCWEKNRVYSKTTFKPLQYETCPSDPLFIESIRMLHRDLSCSDIYYLIDADVYDMICVKGKNEIKLIISK